MNNRYLSLDIGTKTIGLAVSNGIIASPYKTLVFVKEYFAIPINELIEIIKSENITNLVVGYPKNMNNSLGERVKMVDYFLTELKKQINNNNLIITINLIDERLTTRIANQIMLEANLSRIKRKEKKDTLAAQLILETFLQQQSYKK